MSPPIVDETIAAPFRGEAEDQDPRTSALLEKLKARRPLLLKAGAGISALLAAALVAWALLLRPAAPEELTYSELLRRMEAGEVAAITVVPGREIHGTWSAAHPVSGAGESFVVAYPVSTVDDLARRAEGARVEVTLQQAGKRSSPRDVLGILLQLGIVGAIGVFLYQHHRGQQGGELGETVRPGTTFDDVAGTQGAAEELRELVEFLKRPESFAAVGARIPKGALLVGPPGTGKTLLARAVAGEAGVPFFSLSGSEVTGFIVGLGAHRIRTLFKKARKKGGVIFIDEIDALGGKRGRNQSHNEDDRTLNQLLVEMDGFTPSDGVVVIAATNRPDDLDAALKRPGRFDRTVTVGLPTAEGREAILRLHAGRRGIPLHPEVDLHRLAHLSPGSSGAELAHLLNESAIAAAREGESQVRWRHVEAARDRMLLGKERVGFTAQAEEWRTVAYHEAGHAIAGVVCCPEDGLHKVTIQPRGQAMGVAFFAPDGDRHLYRRRYLEGQIVKGLAGRAAEELVFGADAITNGAGHDLVQVNGIARKMVYQLGMGAETGLLVHDGQPGSLSGEAHARMDREVGEILDALYREALEVLRANRVALDALAQALLERETLDGAEALRLLEEHGLQHGWGAGPARERVPAVRLAGTPAEA
ncbi:MAG: AAA family ATPase [Gemmatimonadota bacterium]|nr:AAA family ATPase [Gemmatimonadota bacterium]